LSADVYEKRVKATAMRPLFRRVRRTPKLLQKAMLEAASEKGFTHVTVSDITDRARVNRATFYRHYENKYDLLTKYMEELSGLIEEDDREDYLGNETMQPPDTPPPGMVKVLRDLQANADFYRVMLGKQGDPAIARRPSVTISNRDIAGSFLTKMQN
jgi:AcrR family transcriptional regulator